MIAEKSDAEETASCGLTMIQHHMSDYCKKILSILITPGKLRIRSQKVERQNPNSTASSQLNWSRGVV